jgi:hypothetical protein
MTRICVYGSAQFSKPLINSTSNENKRSGQIIYILKAMHKLCTLTHKAVLQSGLCGVGSYSSLTGCLLILVFQFPVPTRPEKRQNTGTEPKCSDALSPTSVHSDYRPPSDEVIDVEDVEDNGQDSSMVQLHKCHVPHQTTTVTCVKHPSGVCTLTALAR